MPLCLNEFIKDGSVLNHRSSEFFSTCFYATGPHCNGVRHAVVFHHTRVTDRDIRGALFKAVFGKAASLKKRSDQVVGLSNRGFRVVDEAGLHRLPLSDEPFLLRGAEFANVQCIHTGFALGQLCFGFAWRAMLQNSAGIFRPESIAEGLSAVFAAMLESRNRDDNEENKHYCCGDELGIRKVVRHCVLLGGISAMANSYRKQLP